MERKYPEPEPVTPLERGKPRFRFIYRVLLLLMLVFCLGVLLLVALVSLSPHTGARGANMLRGIFGPEAVAKLESIVFIIQDGVDQVTFYLKESTPAAPWATSIPQGSDTAGYQTTSSINPTSPPNSLTNATGSDLKNVTGIPAVGSTHTAVATGSNLPKTQSPPLSPTLMPTQTPWKPNNLSPLGTIVEEGTWVPYIQDAANNVLAYRTFLQPDPVRPYAVVGIIAIDLTKVRLHFQIGTLEPKSLIAIPRTGQIPASEMQPGTLLAAFNGGFKTINGHFGVFQDGVELVPLVDGLGTLAIHEDGSVKMGEWGTDLEDTSGIVTYRQNCPLMVQDGEINPRVFNDSVNDWGGTISNNIVTYRSGIGLSRDGNTLFYFAGNNLSVALLAKVMQTAGAYQGMQLDINSYYVLFTRFIFENGEWIANPLLPNEMVDNVGRYLGPSPHDFFYLTAVNP